MRKIPILLAALVLWALPAAAQHSSTLTWTASTSQAGCASPCTFGYNVFRGTTPGGEGATPLNATPVVGTAYVDSTVSLGNTYYYRVVAVETTSGVTVAAAPSNEVSCTFPSQPAPATNLSVKAK